METVLLLVAVGAAIYLFLRSNTERGIETVRSAIFLWGKLAGVTDIEADRATHFDAGNLPPETIREAMDFLRVEYGGKQLSMIGDAYRLGMTPRLPHWYRTLAGLTVQPEQTSMDSPLQRAAPNGRKMNTGALSYEAYEQQVVAEAKRLDGKAATELHWIELVDHEGTRRAYSDGVDPKALAASILKVGMPPPTVR